MSARFPTLTVQVAREDEDEKTSSRYLRSLPSAQLKSEESNDSEVYEFDEESEFPEQLGYCPASAGVLGSVKSLPVSRLLTTIDSKEISPASIERANKLFKPSGNDVVLVGAGIVGEPIVVRMIRLLGARHEAEVDAWSLPFVNLSNAPLIESSAYDSVAGLEILNSKQAPFQRRVFRTSMTCKALQERLADPESRVKYVVLLRHPKDARLAYHHKCRRAFSALTAKRDEDESDALDKFDGKFSPDDFVNSPGNHVVPSPEIDAYEANLADWTALPKTSNVLLLLLEEVLAHPERALDRIALHLGYYTSEVTEKVLNNVTGQTLMRSKRCTEDLTHEQRSFLRARANRLGAGDLRLRTAMNAAPNVSARGIFVDVRVVPASATSAKARKLSEYSPRTSIRASVVGSPASVSLLSEASDAALDGSLPPKSALSPEALAAIRDKWRRAVFDQGGCSSYESLYTKLTGDEYPCGDVETAERRPSQVSQLASSFRRLVTRPRLHSTRSSTENTGSQTESCLSPLSARGEGSVCGEAKKNRTDSNA